MSIIHPEPGYYLQQHIIMDASIRTFNERLNEWLAEGYAQIGLVQVIPADEHSPPKFWVQVMREKEFVDIM